MANDGVPDALFKSISSVSNTEPAAKRQKLFRYDHAAVMLFQPFGISTAHTASLTTLWEFASKGNKKVAYYTEFASNDPLRRGIAISRVAEALSLTIKELQKDEWGKLLEKKVYAALTKEMAKVSEWLLALDFGKRLSTGLGASSSASMAQPKPASKYNPEEAARALYEFLDSPNSVFRGVLGMLSAGGLFYGAFMADKCARASIAREGGNLSSEAYAEAARARASDNGKGHSEGDLAMNSSQKSLFELAASSAAAS